MTLKPIILNIQTAVSRNVQVHETTFLKHFSQSFLLCQLLMQELFPTCPVEVKARDDWLPAQTFLMNIPCRASTTFGL